MGLTWRRFTLYRRASPEWVWFLLPAPCDDARDIVWRAMGVSMDDIQVVVTLHGSPERLLEVVRRATDAAYFRVLSRERALGGP